MAALFEVSAASLVKWCAPVLLVALRHDDIDADYVLDGPISGARHTAYAEQFLVPTRMDNLVGDKGQAACQTTLSAALLA